MAQVAAPIAPEAPAVETPPAAETWAPAERAPLGEPLGEFDPFASGTVRAIVAEVAPQSHAPVGPIAPSPRSSASIAATPRAAPSVPSVPPATAATAASSSGGSTLAMPPAAFPDSGAIEKITAQHAVALGSIIGVLDRLDYFQVLRLQPDAQPVDIKKAFYRESRTYHPDRFFHLPDQEVKADISHVYKRITEAYYFLRDDAKRKKYLADITGPDRKGRIRFTEVSEVETKEAKKKEQEEQIGTHPKGRQFFATAMADFDRSQWAAAQRSLKMALTYEPSNAKYKEKLAEVQVKLDEMFKQSPDKFKIR